ncbi:MAG: NADH-quinone oxidoreductase subunit N [Sphingobacterium sp.]
MDEFAIHISANIDQIIDSIPLLRVELTLAFAFLLTVASSLLFDPRWKHTSFLVSSAGILIAFIALLAQYGLNDTGFFGMLLLDSMAFYTRMIILLALLIANVFFWQEVMHQKVRTRAGDLYSVLMASGVGLLLLTVTTHWLLAFIAIEMVSICSYIMVGYFSDNRKQAEAAMKYALFGSACSAIMLYGLSLIYGFTGELDFTQQTHIQGLMRAPDTMLSIAFLFVFTGIGFKLSFVPFHLWTPDVYQGAPTSVTAYLSTAPKIGAIVLFARLYSAWSSTDFYFSDLTYYFLSVVAIGTMLVGNLIALRQNDIKRMMAYSSIGHTGFLLMALVGYAHGQQDILLFYILIYTLMNLAAFAFIAVLEARFESTALKSYTGQGYALPVLFTCFAIVGISLVGLPPTAGFVGKLLVFTDVFQWFQYTNDPILLWMLIVGALTSVISLFYYFKIPLYAFLRQPKENSSSNSPQSTSVLYIIGLCLTVLLVVLGLFPSLVLDILAN